MSIKCNDVLRLNDEIGRTDVRIKSDEDLDIVLSIMSWRLTHQANARFMAVTKRPERLMELMLRLTKYPIRVMRGVLEYKKSGGCIEFLEPTEDRSHSGRVDAVLLDDLKYCDASTRIIHASENVTKSIIHYTSTRPVLRLSEKLHG